MNNKEIKILLASPRGFCAGVERAIEIVKKSLKKYFTYSFIPAPYTLFENIYQLEPGENVLINLESLNINKKKY